MEVHYTSKKNECEVATTAARMRFSAQSQVYEMPRRVSIRDTVTRLGAPTQTTKGRMRLTAAVRCSLSYQSREEASAVPLARQLARQPAHLLTQLLVLRRGPLLGQFICITTSRGAPQVPTLILMKYTKHSVCTISVTKYRQQI